MNKKKVIISAILMILIVAGIIVVAAKGFNVGLSLRPYNTLEYGFDKTYDISEIKKVCDEVFKKKDYRIREVEIFGDTVYIEANTITEEEKKALVEKMDLINQKEQTEEKVNYYFYYTSNIRLRDEINQYIMPSIITIVILVVYAAIRFNKLNNGRFYLTVLKLVLEMIVILLTILSIIAICRLSVEKTTFVVLAFVELIYLVIKFWHMENKLK